MNYCASKLTAPRSRSLFRESDGNGLENKFKIVHTEKEQDEKNTHKDDYILCRVCNHKITTFKEKIVVNGSHNHTFANPNGIIFDIGCYQTAPGCLHTGPFTDEFSWFKGFMWRISVCSSCLTHLGWLFLSSSKHSFNGLITDRLVDSSE